MKNTTCSNCIPAEAPEPFCSSAKRVSIIKPGTKVKFKGKVYEVAYANNDGTIRLYCDDENHENYAKEDGTIGCYQPINLEVL